MYGDLKRELMSSTFSNIFIILRHNLEFNNKYFLFKFSNWISFRFVWVFSDLKNLIYEEHVKASRATAHQRELAVRQV